MLQCIKGLINIRHMPWTRAKDMCRPCPLANLIVYWQSRSMTIYNLKFRGNRTALVLRITLILILIT